MLADDSNRLSMTAEEEEALLAEYGTQSAYDEYIGVDVEALRGEYHSTAPASFLTGTKTVEGEEEQEEANREAPIDPSEALLPLPLLVQKLASSSEKDTAFGSSELFSAVDEVVQERVEKEKEHEQQRRERRELLANLRRSIATLDHRQNVHKSAQREPRRKRRAKRAVTVIDEGGVEHTVEVAVQGDNESGSSSSGDDEGRASHHADSTRSTGSAHGYLAELQLFTHLVNGEDLSVLSTLLQEQEGKEGANMPTADIVLPTSSSLATKDDYDTFCFEKEIEELKRNCTEVEQALLMPRATNQPEETSSSTESEEGEPINNPELEDPEEQLTEEDIKEIRDLVERRQTESAQYLSPEEFAAINDEFNRETEEIERRMQLQASEFARQTAAANKTRLQAWLEVEREGNDETPKENSATDLLDVLLLEAQPCAPIIVEDLEELDRQREAAVMQDVQVLESSSSVQRMFTVAEDLSQQRTVTGDHGPTPSSGALQPVTLRQPESSAVRLLDELVRSKIPVQFDEMEVLDGPSPGTATGISAGHEIVGKPTSATGITKKDRAKQREAKVSARGTFLRERESRERRLMRVADDESAKVQRGREVLLDQQQREIELFFQEEERKRKTIFTNEAIGKCDIATKEARQRESIIQWLRHQAQQKAANASKNIFDGESVGRGSVETMEEDQWAGLVDQFQAGQLTIQEAVEAAAEARRRQMELRRKQRCNALREQWAKAVEQSASSTKEVIQKAFDIVDDGSTSHAALTACHLNAAKPKRELTVAASAVPWVSAVQQHLAAKDAWASSAKEVVGPVLHALAAATAPLKEKGRSKSPVPPASGLPQKEVRPLTGRTRSNLTQAIEQSNALNVGQDAQGDEKDQYHAGFKGLQPLDEDRVMLSAEVVQRHHPELSMVAHQGPSYRLPHAARSLSVTLEGIEGIDTNSLQATAFGQPPKRIRSSVESLDLSTNSLSTLDIQKISEALPSLRRLVVNDNQLSSVGGGTSTTAGSASSLPKLTTLEASINKLTTLKGLDQLPSLTVLKCFSNSVESTLGLEHCPRLVELELHRNSLSQLSNFDRLLLLRSVDLSRNQLPSLCDGLKNNVLLEKLFASSNRISTTDDADADGGKTPSHNVLFLRQLFVNDNLMTRPPMVGSHQWTPFLTLLHLEGNKITDLKPLAFCTQLASVKLAFNQLIEVAQFYPLVSSKGLRDISTTDNPCTSTEGGRQSIREEFLVLFPHLREVDNELVGEDERQRVLRNFFASNLQHVFALALRTPVHARSVLQALSTPTKSSSCFFLTRSWGKQGTAALVDTLLRIYLSVGDETQSFTPTSRHIALGLENRASRMQHDYDLLSIASRRSYQEALSAEEQQLVTLKRRSRKLAGKGTAETEGDEEEQVSRAVRGTTVKLDGKSALQVGEENRLRALALAGDQLQELRDISTTRLAPATNAYSKPKAYEIRARHYRERTAAAKLLHWLKGLILCRRAKADIQERRRTSKAYRTAQLTKAALKIQPRWRGAVTRIRLQRARALMEDDEDDLAPVSWVEPVTDRERDKTLTALLHTAIQQNPEAIQMQFAMGGLSSLSSHNVPSAVALSSDSGQPRVGSAPAGTKSERPMGAFPAPSTPETRKTDRASSSGVLVPTSPQGYNTRAPVRGQHAQSPGPALSARPGTGESADLDNEWGSAIASQLKKKEKKMDKARREQARKDYISDPLGYKKRTH